MLGELATTSATRTTEYKARKTRYDQRTFRRDEADYAISDGWELVRENQSSDRYQKLKLHDEQLENEFWCLLYNFGYPNLNVGRNFQIEITSNKRVTVSKQIDVFGYDHDTRSYLILSTIDTLSRSLEVAQCFFTSSLTEA